MREEIALLLSLTIGGVLAGITSLFGDAQAQYGALLAFIGYPFFIGFGALAVLTVRYILSKLKLAIPLAYIVFGGVVAILLGCIIGSSGNQSAGVVFGVGIFASFCSFAFFTMRTGDSNV